MLSIYFKEVRGAKDAMEAFEMFNQKPTDVVLADIQMPQVDGLHFLQKIASISPSTLRVVMTAFNTQTYINRAVEAEVNFYFKKPIDIDELLIAISSNVGLKSVKTNTISLGNGYIYNYDQKSIITEKNNINLTKKEVLLIELLIDNKNSIVSLEQIENSIWDEPVTNDAIRMVITGLRKKLYKDCIQNIKGLGYKLIL